MKKRILFLGILVLCSLFATFPLQAEEEISVNLFGEKLNFDVPPQIIDGYTMVPMRSIFEKLGYEVSWDENTQTVSAYGENTILMTVNSYNITKNGVTSSTVMAPQIIDARTLIPLRVLSETLGYTVSWDEPSRTVTITNGNNVSGFYIANADGSVKNPAAPQMDQLLLNRGDLYTAYLGVPYDKGSGEVYVRYENASSGITLNGERNGNVMKIEIAALEGVKSDGNETVTLNFKDSVSDADYCTALITLVGDYAPYKAQCKTISWENAIRSPYQYRLTDCRWSGKVEQVVYSEDGIATLRLNLMEDSNSEQEILVEYKVKETDRRILEGDIVTVYGKMNGNYSYTSLGDKQITLPLLVCECMESVR